jgi:uncharacterized membrane protein YfcA
MTDILIIIVFGFLAATLSGVVGFGGALFLLPILTNTIGIESAIPVLTIGQIFGNGSRVWFGRQKLKWKPILYFLATAIPLTILGSKLFVEVDKELLTKLTGAFLIVIVGLRRLNVKLTSIQDRTMLIGGGLTGVISGLVGSAGPIGALFFLGLNLTTTAYIASEAMTALTIHVTKTIVYQKYELINNEGLRLGLILGLTMILGSWTGKKLTDRLKREHFILIVEILLVVTGLQMIIWS